MPAPIALAPQPARPSLRSGLTPAQTVALKALTEKVAPLRSREARAPLESVEWQRRDHDLTQVSNVSVRAPALSGAPDANTYTRVGLFAGVPGSLSDDLYLYLYDAKGQAGSSPSDWGSGGPKRIVRLDDEGLQALVKSNDPKELERAFDALFENLRAGGDRAEYGWTMR